MSVPYKNVLLIGATAGIGAAMADKFVTDGVKVVAVGRRQDRLDAFVAKHGKDKAAAIRYDITDTAGLDGFVHNVTSNHPDVDCVVLNAGMQHPVNLSKPETVDLAKFHMEINVNFTSFVNLSVKLLPFLMTKQSHLVFIGTHLSFVPAAGLSAYSCSKGALANFAICLREQIRDSSVKVVDLWPPPVQSELHDYMGEEKGRAFGMPVGEFTDQAVAELATGKEQIIIGTGPAPKGVFDELVGKRNELAATLAKNMRAAMAANK